MTTIRAKIRRMCAGMFAAVALAACGAHEDEQQRPPPPPVEDTAFGPMVGTMEKARGVEDTTLQHKEDLDRELERQESASGPDDRPDDRPGDR
jgi:hypothetical protein